MSGNVHAFIAVAMVIQLQDTGQPYEGVTIIALPNELILEIFNYFLDQAPDDDDDDDDDAWHTLVHVCRQWRHLVFASSKHLNIRLLCTRDRLAKDLLDLWPPLPIIISDSARRKARLELEGAKTIVAAFKERDRICIIDLRAVPALLWKPFLTMVEPFPVLTSLTLHSGGFYLRTLPDSFLGGASPCLQELHLYGIPFPALGDLLLSTNNLINLHLEEIPHSGYITPQAMVTSLPALTRLESCILEFRFRRSVHERTSQRPLTMKRVVLHALIRFKFQGDSEYLEEIVSQIDTPRLKSFTVTFFDRPVFNIPQLRDFISRTEPLRVPHRVDVAFRASGTIVTFYPPNAVDDHTALTLGVKCGRFGPQFSSLVQLCVSSLPPLPTLECLHTRNDTSTVGPIIEPTAWVELLRLFSSLKNVDLSGKLVSHVAFVLKELSEGHNTLGVTEVLPTLKNILVDDRWVRKRDREAIEEFVVARQRSGSPVVVQYQEKRACVVHVT